MRNIIHRGISEKEISPDLPVVEDKELIMKELDRMGRINSVKIDKKNGEYVVTTVAEAEALGFRRAFKWHGESA